MQHVPQYKHAKIAYSSHAQRQSLSVLFFQICFDILVFSGLFRLFGSDENPQGAEKTAHFGPAGQHGDGNGQQQGKYQRRTPPEEDAVDQKQSRTPDKGQQSAAAVEAEGIPEGCAFIVTTQINNGVAVRMAVLFLMLGGKKDGFIA